MFSLNTISSNTKATQPPQINSIKYLTHIFNSSFRNALRSVILIGASLITLQDANGQTPDNLKSNQPRKNDWHYWYRWQSSTYRTPQSYRWNYQWQWNYQPGKFPPVPVSESKEHDHPEIIDEKDRLRIRPEWISNTEFREKRNGDQQITWKLLATDPEVPKDYQDPDLIGTLFNNGKAIVITFRDYKNRTFTEK